MDKATATQLSNIEQRTGKTVDELLALVRGSGLSKHGEMVAMLKTDLGMGHGDANLIVHMSRQEPTPDGGAGADDPLAALYTGPKAALRPIHDKLLTEMSAFGPFEVAPKKAYVSYRRKKQFAMIGPATATRVEVGLNVKELPASERLVALKPGEMCNFKLRLGDAQEVDAELVAWLRSAYEAAG